VLDRHAGSKIEALFKVEYHLIHCFQIGKIKVL
jgi:hypothetical protein